MRLTDQQMQDSGALVPFADGKTRPFCAVPSRGSKIRARALPIGQHSDEILRDEGYSADEIARLRRSVHRLSLRNMSRRLTGIDHLMAAARGQPGDGSGSPSAREPRGRFSEGRTPSA
jgi:hypothetical protein